MKKLTYLILLSFSLIACSKDRLDIPPKSPVENPQDPPPGDNDTPDDPDEQAPTIKLRVRMKIGDVVYDNLPAGLSLFSWDNQGQQSLSYHSLSAGINELTLPVDKQKFRFKVSKWGSNLELNVDTKDIVADSVYVLQATKEARKLKSEYVYLLKNNNYVAETKTDYIYNTDGNLDQVVLNRKKSDGRPYVHQVSKFEYQGKQVQRISRFDEANKLYGFTNFTYSNGLLAGIHDSEAGEETIAKLEHYFELRHEVVIKYTYPSRTYSRHYHMLYEDGNLREGNSTTSHHSSELSRYRYDQLVNPYVHMNWPDLYLSHSSKNNVIALEQSFVNDYPVAVPSSHTYTYDSEGYPKELIRTYKSGFTGEYLYTTKTVFVY